MGFRSPVTAPAPIGLVIHRITLEVHPQEMTSQLHSFILYLFAIETADNDVIASSRSEMSSSAMHTKEHLLAVSIYRDS